MGSRAPGALLAVLGSVLLTACGSGVMERGAPAQPEHSGLSASQRCARAAQLSVGVGFPGWHMGAVQFLSATSGVGITAERFPCFRVIKGGAEREVGFQRQPVRLAVTNDGGRSWQLTGTAAPVKSTPGGVAAAEIAAFSRADVWTVVGGGRLFATRDGGSQWHGQPVPAPVVDITVADGFVWALSCPHHTTRAAPMACTPELWRARAPNGSWTRLDLPPMDAAVAGYVHLAIASSHVMIALVDANRRLSGKLLISNSAGRHWTVRPTPRWDDNSCGIDLALTLASRAPSTFWLLCIGGAAAGSSTKGLLRSTNGGASWTTVSAATSLTQRPLPGSIPLAEPSALAVGAQNRVWLSFTFGLAESNDGGRRWRNVPGASDPGGFGTVIDVFDADHAWLLASGAGLWRTTDGRHWRADGPLNTGSS